MLMLVSMLCFLSQALCQLPAVKEFILAEMNKTGKEQKLKGFEFARAIYLEPEPFSPENDLLTPTFKPKRPQVGKGKRFGLFSIDLDNCSSKTDMSLKSLLFTRNSIPSQSPPRSNKNLHFYFDNSPKIVNAMKNRRKSLHLLL